MLLPDLTDSSGNVKHLAVGAGKDSNIYVVDREQHGQIQFFAESDLAGDRRWSPGQLRLVSRSADVRGSPAWFNGTIYYGDAGGTLKAFAVVNAKLSTAPTSQSTISFVYVRGLACGLGDAGARTPSCGLMSVIAPASATCIRRLEPRTRAL